MDTKFASAIILPDGLTPEKVRGYLDRRANDVASVRISIEGADDAQVRHKLREIAHRIKGNAALYGLPELGDAAGELVHAVDRGEWASITRSALRMLDRVDADKLRFRS